MSKPSWDLLHCPSIRAALKKHMTTTPLQPPTLPSPPTAPSRHINTNPDHKAIHRMQVPGSVALALPPNLHDRSLELENSEAANT